MLLPVLVILGERRAGTSSLTARLGQHPGIFMLPKQDRGYFVDDESLTHLFEQIDCSRVLVTTLERVIAEPAPVFREICEFLGIDPEFQFAELRTRRNANWTMTPRPWAERGVMSWLAAGYGLVAEKGVKLLVKDRDRRRRVISKAKSLFFEPAAEQRMSRETRASLEDLYRPHIAALGELLDRSFSEWVLGAPGT